MIMSNYDLTDKKYLQQLLAKHQILPNNRAGQNFLVCPEVVEAALTMLAAGPARVTELGAGLGALTLPLLERGYRVKAVERDEKLAEILHWLARPKTAGKLELIQADLRETTWSWEENYQLAGNIPYNLSGLIIRKLTQLERSPEQAVFLVQREVGERWCAEVPRMHLSTVAVQLWGKAQPLLTVPPGCFWPVPQVTSQLVGLWPRKNNQFTLAEREAAVKLAKLFFQQKRKQIGGVFRKLSGEAQAVVNARLQQAEINPAARPQEVAAEKWVRLNQLIQQPGIIYQRGHVIL